MWILTWILVINNKETFNSYLVVGAVSDSTCCSILTNQISDFLFSLS